MNLIEGKKSGNNKKEISIFNMWYMIVTSSKLIKIEDLSLWVLIVMPRIYLKVESLFPLSLYYIFKE